MVSTIEIRFHCILPADTGDIDRVLQVYDTELAPKLSSENLTCLVDASSLLWRLNVMGLEVGEERWKKVTDAFSKHVGKHCLSW